MLTQLISLPVSLGGTAVFEGGVDAQSIVVWLRGLEGRTALAICLTGALAAALGRAYANCYKVATATAVTVAGHMNKMLSILLSIMIFGARTTWAQAAGMSLCLGSAFAFSFVGLRSRMASKTD